MKIIHSKNSNRKSLTNFNEQSSALEVIRYEYTADEKADIIKSLAVCMSVQRTYGKQANELEITARAFINILNDHPAHDVVAALQTWLKESPNFPTPADINDLLSKEQKFDSRIYQRIVNTQRTGQNLTQWEWEYLNGYEKASCDG